MNVGFDQWQPVEGARHEIQFAIVAPIDIPNKIAHRLITDLHFLVNHRLPEIQRRTTDEGVLPEIVLRPRSQNGFLIQLEELVLFEFDLKIGVGIERILPEQGQLPREVINRVIYSARQRLVVERDDFAVFNDHAP